MFIYVSINFIIITAFASNQIHIQNNISHAKYHPIILHNLKFYIHDVYGICVCISLLKRKAPRAKFLDLDRVEAIIITTTMMMTKAEKNTERERE